MIFNVQQGDVAFDIKDTTQPATGLDPGSSRIFGSVGSLAHAGSRIGVQPHITATSEVRVGALSPEIRARTDWSFGYIQAIALGSFFVVYSGPKSNAGSVRMTINDDTGRVFPDFDEITPEGRAAQPWTRPRATRFAFDPGSGKITCVSSDGPAFVVPASIRNQATAADNFLEFISDTRTVCCALVVEEKGETPSLRFIGHSLWEIKLSFEYKWVRDTIRATNLSKVSVGKFVFGPPSDPDLARMLDARTLLKTSYNKLATDELNRNIRALKSDRKIEQEQWGLSTPRDFFTP